MTASNDNSDRATQPLEAERSQPSFPSRSSMGDETNKSLAGGAVSSASQSANIGRRIRDYELLELLGQGGMGSVWKAKHTRLKRMVALKLLPPERMSDAAAVARFHREMEAVGQLRHPHIIEALDAGEEAGTHYLVMEFVEGIELAALSKKFGPLPIADACELMRQTALGLQHAFEHGLVHRDIKPSNLLLSKGEFVSSRSRETSDPEHRTLTSSATTGILKILDLGLALLQGDVATGSDLTSTGQVMGTLDYIAPEQLADTHAVDIRADLYSLGCTLYRLLTGEPPFSSATLNTAAKKIYAHSFTPPPSLLARRPDAPPELSALVNRLLAKKPDERFATPNEVAAALAPLCAGHNLPALLASASAPSSASDPFASTIIPERHRVHPGGPRASAQPDASAPPDTSTIPPNAAVSPPSAEARKPLRQAQGRGIPEAGVASDAREPRAPQTSPRRRFLIALAGVASLVLAGIVFKTSARRGSPAPAASPDRRSPANSATTNAEGDLRSLPTAGPGAPRTAQTTDPDRAAAEWVLSLKTAETALVGIQLTSQPGLTTTIQRGEPLPEESFQVVRITTGKAEITDRDLARYLPHLARLTRFELTHCKTITDASVPTLREIGGLRSLDVAGTPLSPQACLELMQTLPLEIIKLSARHLTPKLIDLIVATPRFKEVGIAAWAANSQLGTVTDEHLKSLFRAKQLTRLDFYDVTADMMTWRDLPDGLSNLTALFIQGEHFTDAHLMEFVRLTKLEHLGLIRTAITDAGLPALYDSRTLRDLDLTRTAVTPEAVRALHDHIPLCRIIHAGGVLEPKP